MSQNVNQLALRNLHAHGFRNGSVIVRSFRMSHNIQNGKTKGSSTDVSCLVGIGFGASHGFHFRKQSPVQSSLVRVQPFDGDVNGSPLRFDLWHLPLGNGGLKVERPTVAEVQSRPAIHGGTLA
jgi:hypothetical protein